MSDALTYAELAEQNVELLPARTVMQGILGLGDGDGDAEGNEAINVQGDVQQYAGDGDDDGDLLELDVLDVDLL